SKLLRMEFDPQRESGESVRTVEVPVSERNRYSLSDEEVIELARYAAIIEQHYQRPMDIEWGRDGVDGKLYILQARPETVKSQQAVSDVQERYSLKATGEILATGRAIGQKIGSGTVRLVGDASEMHLVQAGDRKSTRLNSSHVSISYAVFCLKKKTTPKSRSANWYTM